MCFKFSNLCQFFLSIYSYNLRLKLALIGDGSLSATYQATSLELPSQDGFPKFECSKDPDTSCYFLAVNTSSHKVCLFDYTSPGSINFTEPSNSNYSLVSHTPITGGNIIVSGIDPSSTPHKFILYSSNHSGSTVNWSVEANATGKLRYFMLC